MSTLLAFIFGPGGIYTVLIGLIGAALLYARKTGKDAVKNEQARAEAKARDVADEIDDAVAGRDPTSNRERLKSWRKS
jgi:hypothetical protein